MIKHFNKLSWEMINCISFLSRNWKLTFYYVHCWLQYRWMYIFVCIARRGRVCDLMVHSSFKINSAVVGFSTGEQRGKRTTVMYLCIHDSYSNFYYLFGREKTALKPLLSSSWSRKSLSPESWENLSVSVADFIYRIGNREQAIPASLFMMGDLWICENIFSDILSACCILIFSVSAALSYAKFWQALHK